MKTTLLVCVHQRLTDEASCGGRGGGRLLELVEAELKRRDLPVTVEPINCFSRCPNGPVMRIAPGGDFFERVGEEDLPTVVDAVERAVNDTDP